MPFRFPLAAVLLVRENAELREEQHAREMRVMRRLIAGGGQVFATFLDGARGRLREARLVIDGASRTSPWNDLLMSVHTQLTPLGAPWPTRRPCDEPGVTEHLVNTNSLDSHPWPVPCGHPHRRRSADPTD